MGRHFSCWDRHRRQPQPRLRQCRKSSSCGKTLSMTYFVFELFVLTILENANTYIIVNYMTTSLVRSFVRSFDRSFFRSCSRKPLRPIFHHHHHHRGQSLTARTARKNLSDGTIGKGICCTVVAPVARGRQRTTYWTPSW